MPATTRHQIIARCEAALSHIDALDICLYDMEQLAAGRVQALDEYRLPLIEMAELLRQQWKALRRCL
jgi:hypothetical protein